MEQHRFGTMAGILLRVVMVVAVVVSAVVAGGRAEGQEVAPTEDVAVIGEALVIEPGEVVLGPATMIVAADIAPAPATEAVPVQVQVLSSGLERPVTLPRTGMRTALLAGVGAALLSLGGVLVGLGGELVQPAASSATVGR